ncbi:hypothetical protein ACEPAF_2027 [Sanghuangporus sanghuang]
MVVKLYGLHWSTCTEVVITVLKELGVPYEFEVVNLSAGDNRKPEYIENLHPFGQIPVLVDEDGFKIFESRAIARYLIAKYGPNSGLIPKDLKKNALFEQAMSIENNDFAPPAGGLAGEKYFKPMLGLQPSEETAAEHESTLEKNLQAYERILSKQKYLAGDELTLADLLHLPNGSIITDRVGFKGLKATPNVARWWKDISSRESWKSVEANAQAFLAKALAL